MPAVVRIGDRISCGDVMGQGSPNVFANGIAISRTGVDKTRGHCFNPVPIIKGSPNVFINNLPVNGKGGNIPPHRCGRKVHAGVAVTGSPNVFINVGGPEPVEAPTEEQQQAVIAENVDAARQPTASRQDFAYTITDDHEAPTIGPAAPAVLEYRKQVEAEEGPTPPQQVTELAETQVPSRTLVPTDCSDIDSHVGPFPGSFQLSPNYTLAMLTTNTVVSNYAIKANVGLTEKQIVCNLRQLCNNILEPLKAVYGADMKINSGFRSNGGRSQHERGQAADIAFTSIQNDVDAMFLRAKLIAGQVPYDQMIFERARTFWIHLSFAPAQRNQELTLVYGTTNRYVPGIVKTTA